jgi:hypothetical protein
MRILMLFLFIGICLISCQPENQQPKPSEIAKQGMPVGDPILKEIGSEGGIIDIEVNNSKVIFPKNAVAVNTLVSIQPITNTLANYGLGLRISSHFKKIEIQFKYPQNGLPPENFEIYYLKTDSPNFGWYKFKNKSIDTINHTISIIQDAENQSSNASSSAKVATHSFDYVVGK